MSAADRLLKLESHPLRVIKNVDNKYSVNYENSHIKGNGVLYGRWGIGDTFEEACEDYLNIISGETLVFNAFDEDMRTEVKVL